jgi:acyl-coenzyme A synthetase/AMP-(fatty) acid ligase
MKDAIRRRGENISAFELECEVNLHPAVLESAAIVLGYVQAAVRGWGSAWVIGPLAGLTR